MPPRTRGDRYDDPPDEEDYFADAPQDTRAPARATTSTVTTSTAGFLRALDPDTKA